MRKQLLDYGIIGNCKTCALVKQDASIDWFCFPTFSSPSYFARLLDEEKGGALRIDADGYEVTQQYLPETAILETIFEKRGSSFVVQDFMPRYRKLTKHNHKLLVRQNKIIRIIKPLKGKPSITIRYRPRPDYAREEGRLVEDLGQIFAGDLSLITNIDHEHILEEQEFTLNHTRYLVLGEQDDPSSFSVRRCAQLMAATKRYWHKWCGTLITPEENSEEIVRSAITLKLLTNSKTGAIIAAATTSIPEEIGSPRTWDYRFCWVRDAAFCADALKKIGRNYESKKLMEFIINEGCAAQEGVCDDDLLQIMYGINGERDLKERTLDHLSGFKGTQPVRIGNAAFNQEQHDIYGEVIDLMYLYFCYYRYERKMTKRYWRFVVFLVNQIEKRWKRKDSGIWEFRGEKQHFTFSKLMCWVGVDRAIKMAQTFGHDAELHEWIPLRDEIKQDILEHAWNPEKKAFTMFYGSDDLDAAVLLMTYHDFLPHHDPRIISTVKAIYEELRKDGLVQRYTRKDDFGASSSAFTICSFWLVDSLYLIGEEEKAREIYRALLERSNHLGLYSEDIDLRTKRLIGNFPQAYTHIALINSSILLSEWAVTRKRIDWESLPERRKWI